MMKARFFLRLRPSGDEGYVLLTVTAAIFVMTLVATAGLGYALNGMKFGKRDSDWTGALSAAQSGVDDFVSRLNIDDGYWKRTPQFALSAGVSNSSPDCANKAMKKAFAASPAPCNWSTGTPVDWAIIPNTAASFHYDIDVSTALTAGTLTITSTGWVGTAKRTVRVLLGRAGFGDFLYMSNYETTDPAYSSYWGFNNTTAQTKCAQKYLYAPDSRPINTTISGDSHRYCPLITFTNGDSFDGPVHSNDEMNLGGSPVFKGKLTTSYPGCQNATSPSNCWYGSSTPELDQGIAYHPIIDLPTDPVGLKDQTDSTKTTTPGCRYTGPTRIAFQSDGTMKVWSNFSKTTLNPGCGNPAAPWPQTIAVPNNNVIYVQDVPSGQATPAAGPCAAGAVGDGFPLAGDYNNSVVGGTSTPIAPEAECRSGTVYVEGTVKGAVTVATDNSVLITGNLVYAGGHTGPDILGLVAKGWIGIYHPVKCTSWNVDSTCVQGNATNMNRPNGTTFTDPRVEAAMLALTHSFTAESYNQGSRLGTINLFGSLAQKYRGPVGLGSLTTGNGYAKSYNYDPRLHFSTPPFFLSPSESSWTGKTFAETSAAY
jgi:hypothetical protein